MTIVVTTIYLLALSIGYVSGLIWLNLQPPNSMIEGISLAMKCSSIAGLGGCLYCARAIYLNACVRNDWSVRWLPWYFIRPLVSAGCGLVSYVFLRAGLLVLESPKSSDASDLGFFAIAFIAGLNVDKFIGKIEEIAQSVWGIERSRAGRGRTEEGAIEA